jgi:outer membrane protein TolC
LKDTEERVRAEVAHNYRRIIEARKELELAQALQSSHTEALRVVGNRYAQHEAVLSDVLKIQSSVADANHRYTEALTNLATAQADFERALGGDQ